MDSPASGLEQHPVALPSGSPIAHCLEKGAGGPYQLFQNRGQQAGVASTGMLQTTPVGDPLQLHHVLKVGFLLPKEICSRREPRCSGGCQGPLQALSGAWPTQLLPPASRHGCLAARTMPSFGAVCDLGYKRATAERMGRPAAGFSWHSCRTR